MIFCIQDKKTGLHLLRDIHTFIWKPGSDTCMANRKQYLLKNYNHMCIVGVLVIKEETAPVSSVSN